MQYSSGQKIAQIARDMSLTRPLVERCIDKALQFGPISGLNDLPRSGRPIEITDDAKNWVLSLACKRPVELGYAAETWIYSALVKHIR